MLVFKKMRIKKWFPCVMLLGLFCLALFPGCGDSEEEGEKRSVPLAMDIPKPVQVEKTAPLQKKMPDIQKSSLEFVVTSEEINRQTAEHTITDTDTCLQQVVLVEKEMDAVWSNGGLWGFIEQVPDFKEYSALGMQLDNKINKMVFALRHVCENSQGMPYTEMAETINNDLKSLGEGKLREKLIDLGTPSADADRLIDYGRYAQEAKGRTIGYPSIQESILWGKMFVENYRKFAEKLADPSIDKAVLSDLQAFYDALSQFLSKNKNMVLALTDDLQQPYGKYAGGM